MDLREAPKEERYVANKNQSLGDLEHFEQISATTFQINTTQGKARVSFYTPEVARIIVSKNDSYEDFNYAVVAEPQDVEIIKEDDHGYVTLKTAKLTLEIHKYPVRFIFKSPEGKVLNEDDTFGTSWLGEQVTTYKKLQKGERFIGLGEKTGHLDRFGKGYQNWNTDYFSYGKDADPLYVSIPFYMGIHPAGMYGIFLNNSHKTHFNFGASNNRFSSFSADTGLMDYFFFAGDNVADIIQNYTWLTGRMPMPPKWSIGYQQCRYSYYPDSEVVAVANHFRDKDIPADAIVLDIHYMDQYKIFTWDKARFPDPEKLIGDICEQGFNIVVMCDPGIKVEDGYYPYTDGVDKDIFIKYPDGELYQGEVWPGWCHFPDFTKPEARDWWQEQIKAYTEIGVTGFWNDMNEIATWGNMLPELIEMDFDGHKATARKGRNIYGMQMARSTYESTRANLQKRPFNLTRAGFSGVQRYAAVWTGDNIASDEHMLLGIRLVNSLGLSGVSFTGYDVGGFVGNADEKLFARWVSIGAFAPFYRGHSMINSRDSEPWAYGEEVEEISRNYIKLRYRMLPYLYSLFLESSETGIPVSRSLAIYHPYDTHIYQKQYENQFYFGPSILVAPVESSKDITKVYLPEGEWYDLYTDEFHIGGSPAFADCPIEKLPVFVKGGSILPMQEAGQNTNHKPETLEIHIYRGNGGSEFVLYEDDGISFENEKGVYHKRKITFDGKKSLQLSSAKGSFKPSWSKVRVYTHGFTPGNVVVNNRGASKAKETYRFIQPISNFDPIGTVKEDRFKIENLDYFEFDYSNDEISLKL